MIRIIKNIRYELLALSCALMWGLQFPLISFSQTALDSVAILLLRFGIASVVLGIINFKRLKGADAKMIFHCIALGILAAVYNLFMVEGIKYTTSANSGFITSTNVVFVPFFAYLFFREKPTRNVIYGLVAIVVGFLFISGMITVDGRWLVPSNFSLSKAFYFGMNPLNYGDFLTVIGAILTALFFVYLNHLTKTYDEGAVSFLHMAAGSVVLFVMWLFAGEPISLASPPILLSTLYCGVLSGGIAFYLLSVASAHMSSAKTSILCGLEPIFAVIFATFIPNVNGVTEPVTLTVVIGGAFIIYGAIKSALMPEK